MQLNISISPKNLFEKYNFRSISSSLFPTRRSKETRTIFSEPFARKRGITGFNSARPTEYSSKPTEMNEATDIPVRVHLTTANTVNLLARDIRAGDERHLVLTLFEVLRPTTKHGCDTSKMTVLNNVPGLVEAILQKSRGGLGRCLDRAERIDLCPLLERLQRLHDQSGLPYLEMTANQGERLVRRETLGTSPFAAVVDPITCPELDQDTLTWEVKTDVQRVQAYYYDETRKAGFLATVLAVPLRAVANGPMAVRVRLRGTSTTLSLVRARIREGFSLSPRSIMAPKWSRALAAYAVQNNPKLDQAHRTMCAQQGYRFEVSFDKDTSLIRRLYHDNAAIMVKVNGEWRSGEGYADGKWDPTKPLYATINSEEYPIHANDFRPLRRYFDRAAIDKMLCESGGYVFHVAFKEDSRNPVPKKLYFEKRLVMVRTITYKYRKVKVMGENGVEKTKKERKGSIEVWSSRGGYHGLQWDWRRQPLTSRDGKVKVELEEFRPERNPAVPKRMTWEEFDALRAACADGLPTLGYAAGHSGGQTGEFRAMLLAALLEGDGEGGLSTLRCDREGHSGGVNESTNRRQTLRDRARRQRPLPARGGPCAPPGAFGHPGVQGCGPLPRLQGGRPVLLDVLSSGARKEPEYTSFPWRYVGAPSLSIGCGAPYSGPSGAQRFPHCRTYPETGKGALIVKPTVPKNDWCDGATPTTGIFSGPLGFHVHDAGIGGTRTDREALEAVFAIAKEQAKAYAGLQGAAAPTVFSAPFRACHMSPGPAVELSAASLSLGVEVDYGTLFMGPSTYAADHEGDVVRRRPHDYRHPKVSHNVHVDAFQDVVFHGEKAFKVNRSSPLAQVRKPWTGKAVFYYKMDEAGRTTKTFGTVEETLQGTGKVRVRTEQGDLETVDAETARAVYLTKHQVRKYSLSVGGTLDSRDATRALEQYQAPSKKELEELEKRQYDAVHDARARYSGKTRPGTTFDQLAPQMQEYCTREAKHRHVIDKSAFSIQTPMTRFPEEKRKTVTARPANAYQRELQRQVAVDTEGSAWVAQTKKRPLPENGTTPPRPAQRPRVVTPGTVARAGAMVARV